MKKNIMIVISVIAILGLLVFAGTQNNSNVKHISHDELKEILNEDYQFVDIRTSAEYEGVEGPVHIEEFDINLDYYKFKYDYRLLDDLDKEKPIVIICNSGNRSLSAGLLLEELGFTEIYNVEKGIKNWY